MDVLEVGGQRGLGGSRLGALRLGAPRAVIFLRRRAVL